METDTEKRLADTAADEEGGALPCVQQTAGGDLTQGAQHSDNLDGCNWVGGGREVQEGGDLCIPMADPC